MLIRLAMKKIITTMFFLIFLAGLFNCGSMPAPAPSAPPLSKKSKDYFSREMKAGAMEDRAVSTISESEADEPRHEAPAKEKQVAIDRIVIYKANYNIRVKSIKDSLMLIDKLSTQFNGSIESVSTTGSYMSAHIVVRIPVKKFEQAIKQLENIGTITSKNISAQDVTEQYSDMELRLKSAENTLLRLNRLLNKEKNTKEKVKILKEIERITAKIEAYKAQLKYLKSQADYSTIIINLTAESGQAVQKYLPSPFPWINNISPNSVASYEKPDITFNTPENFFVNEKNFYDKKSSYTFITPSEECFIRIYSIDNYPENNVHFWDKAFKIDTDNRLYKTVKKDYYSSLLDDGIYSYNFAVSGGRFYIVAFGISGKNITIIEAVFTDESSYNKHINSVNKFIQSVSLK